MRWSVCTRAADYVECALHTQNGVHNTPNTVCIWRHAEHTVCGVLCTLAIFLQCIMIYPDKHFLDSFRELAAHFGHTT